MILILILPFAIILGFLLQRRTGYDRLPPGPRPLPFIGNIHQHSINSAPWEQWYKWHKQYGPIISFRLGQRTIISIANHKMVGDLLERRARIYSSRPQLIMLNEWLTKGMLGVFMPYGPKWESLRRLRMPLLSSQAVSAMEILLDVETLRLIRALESNPPPTQVILTQFLHSFASTLLYGGTVEFKDDGDVFRGFNDFQEELLSFALTSDAVIEVFPSLVPLLAMFGKFAKSKKRGTRFHSTLLQTFHAKLDYGLRQESWNLAKEICGCQPPDITRDEVAYFLAELELGIVEATSMMLKHFVDIATEQPDAFAAAQNEIDTVVGTQRLPTVENREKLPYVNALITETMRCKTLGPMSIPRAATQQDEYMGYTIPRGSTIILNQWALNNDEDIYTDPFMFKPQRWIETPELPQPFAFGAGKRLCPGQSLAQNILFMSVSRILWAFDIDPVADTIVTHKRQSWLLCEPSDRNVVFQFRSSEQKAIVENKWDAVAKDNNWVLGIIHKCWMRLER
ncbi:hypothetical protein ANOM_007999 [Aspergillus nomiae NRRL 13137]|uniref:Cytochrome P450 n=1 Tax=Aspergillus nomiae NRRL (strain ATCC 15546 / NRRL 13137 / CBS 260.88 / M93) TaxID=1509407 RepID=A0A0L1IX96_ASPN3|nr:uncharacterized protein ANOM_007999 [Aspergillus nomiae NRRL 13137]KNG83803.1 hypothetical protein ANOM_007999 [Aspergillus nomiae NRRL 13137]